MIKWWVGCSGWQYNEWKEIFYKNNSVKSQWLEIYAQHFNSVEINSTFYHFPRAKTVQSWYEQAPQGFCYSVKAHRSITHYRKFSQTEVLLNDFYKLTDLFGDKLGCILFQLPKFITRDYEWLQRVIAQMSVNKQNVIEFQHESWWDENVFKILKQKNIIFANIDAPNIKQGFIYSGKNAYWRFHGPAKRFQGEYGMAFLKQKWREMQNHKIESLWCYFNNTMDGSALSDAKIWQHFNTCL